MGGCGVLPAGRLSTSISKLRFPTQKERGFLFLAHWETISTAIPQHHRVKTKQWRKKPYHLLGRSCSFTQYAKDIREVPIAGTWDFHPKRGTWAQKSSLSGAESHWSRPLLSLQIPEPGEKAIETQSCWYVQKSTKNYSIPMVNLRERGLNAPTCPPEKMLWCFPKITVLKIFALPASTRHITSGEDRGRENVDNWHWGRENANNWHYFNGCGFKTSWGWG